MSCSEEGDSASNGSADSMTTFSRLQDGFRKFAEIHKSVQFSTLSPGFTFEKSICGSAFVESNAFNGPTRFDLSAAECLEFNFDGESYLVLYNFAPLDNNLTLVMTLVFYGQPETRDYNLDCSMMVDCDEVSLSMRIIGSEGEELIRYYGMPNLLSVDSSSNQVTASFDGLFYPDDFEEDGRTFKVAGTLVCCQ